MGFAKTVGASAHEATHRLPGMPDHARAGELNSSSAARIRPLRNRPLQNPGSHHERQARAFAGWQGRIGRRFSRGE